MSPAEDKKRASIIEALLATVDDWDLKTLIAVAKEDWRERMAKVPTNDLARELKNIQDTEK